jgi:RsmE family RNA methyltransferase
MNIIILTEKDFIKENKYTICDERFTHIKRVLKSEVNDVIEIGLLNSSIGKAKIIKINATEALLEIISVNKNYISQDRIDLICALPRPQTLKKVLSTSATMGVRNLYLIRSQKVEKSYFHSPLLEKENYTRYLLEGLSQGKRTDIPNVTIHNRFKQFFENSFDNISKDTICLLAHPNTETYLSKKILDKNKNIVLAIGPEGGWNDFEIDLMVSKGFEKFKLSKNILRVENAVTSSLAQVELVLNQ